MWAQSRVCACVRLACLGLVALLVSGCPSGDGGGGGNTKLTVLFSSDNQAVQKALEGLAGGKAGPVSVDAIESLTIEITQISMDHGGSVSDEGSGEGDGEGNGATKQNPSKIVVFPTEDGPQTMVVNLKELIEVSRALSTVEVPSGKYTKIRLTYQNPEVVFVDDPTIYDDIQTTANSRLFINEKFELPEGESVLIMLDFGGIHLNDTNNNSYTLTPQLQVDLTITSATVSFSGTIASIDIEGGSLVLTTEDSGDVTFVIDAETTVQDGAGTVLALTDLAVGDEVTVEATITVDGFDGPVTANTIIVVTPAGGEEGAGEGSGEGATEGAGEGEGEGSGG